MMQKFKCYVFVLILAFKAGPAFGGPIDDLNPGEWYEVPNSHMRAVLPIDLPAGNPKNIMAAWSGGAYDTQRDRLIIWGGGHADYAGNELYVFDINTAEWTRLTDPSPYTAPGAPSVSVNSDGRPVSRHTYDGLVYLPNIDKFWANCGSRWYDASRNTLTWLFDFVTLEWSRKEDNPYSCWLPMLTDYDPVTGQVITRGNHEIATYDPINDTWSRHLANLPGQVQGTGGGAFDTTRRRFWIIGGGIIKSYNANNWSEGEAVETTTGETSMVNAWYPGLVYDAISDKLVAWNGTADVYSLDPDTKVWTKQTGVAASGSGVPQGPSSTGTFSRWQYVPSKNVFIGVNSIDENVFVYKASENAAAFPEEDPPEGPAAQIDIPTQQWVAVPMPSSNQGFPYSIGKHLNWTYNPVDQRIWGMGGDFSTSPQASSYRQEVYSFSLAERFADLGNRDAGWRLEQPYCRGSGVQPKHPDHMGWFHDPLRNRFWMFPGTMVSSVNAASLCPGETTEKTSDPNFRYFEVMLWDPVTRTWAIAPNNGENGPKSNNTWFTVHDRSRDRMIRFVNDGSGYVIYNPNTGVWTDRIGMGNDSNNQTIRVFKGYIAVDYSREQFYAIDQITGILHRWNMVDMSRTEFGVVPGGVTGGQAQVINLVYDSANDVLLWHHNSPDRFYAFHIDNGTWEDLGSTQAFGFDSTTGRWDIPLTVDGAPVHAMGRVMVYDPSQNVVVSCCQDDSTASPEGLGSIGHLYVYRFGNATTSSQNPSQNDVPHPPSDIKVSSQTSQGQ